MRSIIALPNDYVVVDIETTGTNPKQDDIIEIAAIKCRNGEVVARFSQLVSVERSLSWFISNLTGITNDMLIGKPSIQKVIQDFSDFVGDDILIGHNIAAFDSCFIAEAYSRYLERELTNPCVDTLRIYKKLYPNWPRRSLEQLAFLYGIPYDNAHRGSADCEITNACYQCMRNEILMESSEEEFCNRFAKKSSSKKIREIIPSVNSIDSNHLLYQKAIVFTGALSMTRQEAMQLAVDVGAIPKTSVTTKTAFLVVGGQDISRVGDDGMSSKEEKAHALNASGKAQIKIISETDFLTLIKKEGAST